ncbi:MAG TPA: hypothetical protein VF017_10180 [Thermoanaerobaculia bacterium]|nr:hypothetical protein [Thermoanaerobaculia bacterium]
MDAPVLGADTDYDGPNKWQVSTSWRYQRSYRHFRGTEEEENRVAEGSEVINVINLAEIGVRYNFNQLWSASLNVPYLMATRSSPIRDANRVVVDRSITQARGLSDITLSARRLFWKPDEHPDGNVAVGFGVKLPTGQNNVVDTRRRLVNGQEVRSVETVDQSIQPGDGGFGFFVEAQAYQRIAHSAAGIYFSGAYLFNPEETSGVSTYRSQRGEEIMSIADQYLVRLGVSFGSPSFKGWGFSLGGRMEGVPVEDLIGGSEGFRRPGYAVSVEPAVTWGRGPHSVALAVPIAVLRNRQRSVPDRLEPGRIGDAAFADYVILLGYTRRF